MCVYVCNIMPMAGGFYGRTVHARVLCCNSTTGGADAPWACCLCSWCMCVCVQAPVGKAPDVWRQLSRRVSSTRQAQEGSLVEDYEVASTSASPPPWLDHDPVISDSEEEAVSW